MKGRRVHAPGDLVERGGERPGRARDGSLGQREGRRSRATPQEPEPGRIISAPASVQDRCPAGPDAVRIRSALCWHRAWRHCAGVGPGC
jgi:hypothetical protein